MILIKIYQKKNDVEVKAFNPQYFIADSLEEAEYRIYAGYLENKIAPAYNLPGFVAKVVYSDNDVKFVDKEKEVRKIINDVIDEVAQGKPDEFQVKGKMF